MLSPTQTQKFVDEMWMDSIVPELVEYIKIPNKSPHFDPDWEANGYMEDAVQQIFAWCTAQDIKGMKSEIVRLPGRTPLISSRSMALMKPARTPFCCTATWTSSQR